MRSIDFRPAILLAVSIALSACPSDEGDDSAESTAASTMAASTGDPTNTSPTGSDESGDTMADESTGDLVLADIEVTVTYEGMATGTLSVVALTEFPPMGPPVAVASEMMPTFPYAATLNDLEVGEYIIFAVLDVGNDNPTIPGPEDPVADGTMPVMVTVDGPGPFMAEVTLNDPM